MNKILRLSLICLITLLWGGQASATDVTFTLSNFSGQGVSGGKNDGTSTITATQDDITFTEYNGYGDSSKDFFQCYALDGKITITPNGNFLIKKIVFTASSSSYNGYQSSGTVKASAGTLSKSGAVVTWEGETDKALVIEHNKQMRLKNVVVTYEAQSADAVESPTITGEETFKGSTSVTITAEEGADIYYTTDNNDPTTASTKYNAAFTISETTTVKAIAVKGGKSSNVATKEFTKAQEMTITEAQAAADGTLCDTEGTIVATCARGALIGDGTGYIYYYANGTHPYVIGDKIEILGAVSLYNGFNQFTNTATITKKGTETVTQPTPVSMTGADVTAWAAAPEIKYVTITGALNISSNYYNVTIDGTEIVGSIVSPDEALKAQLTTGKSYAITGYAIYVSGKTTKYMNILPISVADPTSINGITTDAANENAPIYNLAGQRVNKNAKGILIQNGKKFVNK